MFKGKSIHEATSYSAFIPIGSKRFQITFRSSKSSSFCPGTLKLDDSPSALSYWRYAANFRYE